MPPNVQNAETNNASVAVSVAAESLKKTARTTRRRGDFDYHIMLNGSGSWYNSTRTEEAAIIKKNSTSYTELGSTGTMWGETTVEVNGDSKILQLVSSPPSYGRIPNLRATDIGYRAMDGMLQIVKTYPYKLEFGWLFDALKRSYSGENEKYYAAYRERLKDPVLEMYAQKKMNNVRMASNVKVVSFLLVVDEDMFKNSSSLDELNSAKESEHQIRKQIAKLQKKYGTEKIRLYVVSQQDQEEATKDILVKMCEDIENQNGISFRKIAPLSPETLDPKFDKLQKINAAPKVAPTMTAAPTKHPFWKRIFGL